MGNIAAPITGSILVIHQTAKVVRERTTVHRDQPQIEAQRLSRRFLKRALVGYSLAGEMNSEADGGFRPDWKRERRWRWNRCRR